MVLFGLHVSKCAGTTLLLRAMSRLPFNQIYQCTNLNRNFRENRIEFAHINNFAEIKFVFGHAVHEEMLKILKGPVRLFMGLREPRARLESHLLFLAALRRRQCLPAFDIKEEIARHDNGMCRQLYSHFPFLAGEGAPAERALRVLDHCWCVYFSERFEETAAPIFQALNIEPEEKNYNVRQRANNDKEDADKLDLSAARLDQDVILYETALERFSTQRPLSSLAEGNLERFRSQALRPRKLHKSFYRASFNQFRDENTLDELIRHRKRMIAELEAELRCYAELAERDNSSRSVAK